jgi:hypothetical protein
VLSRKLLVTTISMALLPLTAVLAQPADAAEVTLPTAVAASAGFSPNDDGTLDLLPITYTTYTDGIIALEISDYDSHYVIGSTMVSPADPTQSFGFGQTAAGTGTFNWDGTIRDGDGVQQLPDERYRLSVVVIHPGVIPDSCELDLTYDADENCYTLEESTVVLTEIATAAPAISLKTGATVYPVKDGYRDTTTISATFTAHSGYQVALLSSSGATVRSWTGLGRSFTNSWNGKNSAGKVVAPGRYSVRVRAAGKYGNASTTKVGSVSVAAGKRIKRTWSKTLIPHVVVDQLLVGDCSSVSYFKKTAGSWAGGHSYDSLSKVPNCDTGDSTGSLAMAVYSYTLPKAAKYGSVKLSATGRATYASSGDRAALLLGPLGSDAIESVILGSTFDRYSLPWVPQKTIDDRTIVWRVGTLDGMSYAVKRFKLTWTTYELTK